MAQKIIIVIMLCLVILAGVLVLVFSQGSCPKTSSCLPIQECYNLHRGQNSLNNSMLFACSDAAGSVCCPQVPKKLLNLQSNKQLLPIHCGFGSADKISEGQLADIGQFPWMALLSFKKNGSDEETEYLCGGSLISEKYVLTAAHCMFTGSGLPVAVRLGELDLSTEIDCVTHCADKPLDVAVEKVIIHKDYNTPFLKNDIALIRLKTPAPRNLFISSICLPFGINITGEEETEKYTIAGWGKVEHASNNGSKDLLYTRVTSAPVSECNDAQSKEVRPIGDLQLCAGGELGHDACKGDSGGPMMKIRPDENGTARSYQLGIISFGAIPCGKPVPSVYTRVTAYLDWILTHLEH